MFQGVFLSIRLEMPFVSTNCRVEESLPDQNPISNLLGTAVSIRLGLNFESV